MFCVLTHADCFRTLPLLYNVISLPFLPRNTMHSATDTNRPPVSVCPSVRPSVTIVYYIETAKDIVELLILKFIKTQPITLTLLTFRSLSPCTNCNKLGNKPEGHLVLRLQEHKTECESKTKRAFRRSQRTASLAEINKYALTDHANQENHIINRSKVQGSSDW